MARKLRIIKTRRRVALLVLSLFLMLVISALITLFGQPNKAKIVTGTRQDNGKLDLEKGTTTLKGKTFTLQYAANLNTVTDITSQNPNAVEAFRVARNTLEDRRMLIVTIKKPTEGGLKEDSSYRIRQIQSETYKPSQEIINGTDVYLMTKTDNTEVTAFIPHSSTQMAVIAYTAGTSDTIYADALSAIKTFKWTN